jgi:hypothetical protein
LLYPVPNLIWIPTINIGVFRGFSQSLLSIAGRVP